MSESSYANKLKTQLYWWLGRRRPFIINDEYKVELLYIDKVNNSVKIQVTNLSTGEVSSSVAESKETYDESK